MADGDYLGHLCIICKGLRHDFDTMHFIYLNKSIIDSLVNKLKRTYESMARSLILGNNLKSSSDL